MRRGFAPMSCSRKPRRTATMARTFTEFPLQPALLAALEHAHTRVRWCFKGVMCKTGSGKTAAFGLSVECAGCIGCEYPSGVVPNPIGRPSGGRAADCRNDCRKHGWCRCAAASPWRPKASEGPPRGGGNARANWESFAEGALRRTALRTFTRPTGCWKWALLNKCVASSRSAQRSGKPCCFRQPSRCYRTISASSSDPAVSRMPTLRPTTFSNGWCGVRRRNVLRPLPRCWPVSS